jgi:hypothetical protein
MASSSTVSLANSWTLKGVLRLVSGTFSTGGNTFTVDLDNGGLIGYGSGDNGSISGNVSIKRAIGQYTHYLATPFSGVSSNQINAVAPIVPSGGQSRLFGFNFSTQAWVRITSLPTTLSVGTPYSMYFTTPSTTLTFTGGYNPNASYNYSFSNAAANKSQLFGNPFAAALDFSTIVGSATGLTNTVYYWNQSLQAYSTWNSGSGSANGGSQYIPAMQSFLVLTSGSGGTSSIGYTKANISNAIPSPAYYRLTSASDRISLKASDSSGIYDETVVVLDPSATSSFDNAVDAYKVMNPSPSSNLFTSDGTSEYAINVLPPITNNQIIPLNFTPGSDGTYTIAADKTQVSSGKIIFLKDNFCKKTVPLNAPYSFTSSSADGAERFELIVSDNNSSSEAGINFGSFESTVFIMSQGPEISNGTVYVTDITGKQVSVVKNVSVYGIAQLTFDTLAPGIYVIRLTNPSGGEYIGKVSITR